MRKTLSIAAVAISLTSGATVVLAQSSRNLMEVTGTEANRAQTQYGRYTPGSRAYATRRACTADGIGLTGIGDLSERLTKTILQSTDFCRL